MTDAALGPGEKGELVLKGPHNMLGYINNEQVICHSYAGFGL